MFLDILKAFLVGGVLCAIGQLFIDYTKLTPARILTGFVVAGVVLSALGIYKPLVDFAGAGATVPLTGFGHLLAEGIRKSINKKAGFTLFQVKSAFSSPQASPLVESIVALLIRKVLHNLHNFKIFFMRPFSPAQIRPVSPLKGRL